MITRGFFCLFKQVPYFWATSTTGVVQLSAVGTRALFFILIINRTSREKNRLFLGVFFSQFWFMIDALRQRLKPVPVMWSGADVCVL